MRLIYRGTTELLKHRLDHIKVVSQYLSKTYINKQQSRGGKLVSAESWTTTLYDLSSDVNHQELCLLQRLACIDNYILFLHGHFLPLRAAHVGDSVRVHQPSTWNTFTDHIHVPRLFRNGFYALGLVRYLFQFWSSLFMEEGIQ
jgi:hypothetical protein